MQSITAHLGTNEGRRTKTSQKLQPQHAQKQTQRRTLLKKHPQTWIWRCHTRRSERDQTWCQTELLVVSEQLAKPKSTKLKLPKSSDHQTSAEYLTEDAFHKISVCRAQSTRTPVVYGSDQTRTQASPREPYTVAMMSFTLSDALMLRPCSVHVETVWRKSLVLLLFFFLYSP